MKTFIPKNPGTARTWQLVDATDKPLGRLAVSIANALRGKTSPQFSASVDTGDFVIVINAAKVRLTGKKLEKKQFTSYSGWRGGLKKTTAAAVMEKHPERLIMHAVRGMMPNNNISTKMLTRLRVFAGAEHPHAAQKPVKAAF